MTSATLEVPTGVVFVGDPLQLSCRVEPPDVDLKEVHFTVSYEMKNQRRYSFDASRRDEMKMFHSWKGRATGWEEDGTVHVNISRLTLADRGVITCSVTDMSQQKFESAETLSIVGAYVRDSGREKRDREIGGREEDGDWERGTKRERGREERERGRAM